MAAAATTAKQCKLPVRTSKYQQYLATGLVTETHSNSSTGAALESTRRTTVARVRVLFLSTLAPSNCRLRGNQEPRTVSAPLKLMGRRAATQRPNQDHDTQTQTLPGEVVGVREETKSWGT